MLWNEVVVMVTQLCGYTKLKTTKLPISKVSILSYIHYISIEKTLKNRPFELSVLHPGTPISYLIE